MSSTTNPTRPIEGVEFFASGGGPDEAKHWMALIDRLSALGSLADDWDGQGAEAPAPELVDGAIHLARQFQASQTPPACRVLAGVNGTIFFEWVTPAGYAEVEVVSPREAEFRSLSSPSVSATETKITW